MQRCYLGQRAELVDGMPPGVITQCDRWVESAPMSLPGCTSTCRIRGRVDAVVDCDDGTAAIVDFKTAVPTDALVAKYSRQLHAYCTCLEHAARGVTRDVSVLGLLCFQPDGFEAEGIRAALMGELSWVQVERNDEAFLGFLAEVVVLLEGSTPPAPSPECPWCRHRVGSPAVVGLASNPTGPLGVRR